MIQQMQHHSRSGQVLIHDPQPPTSMGLLMQHDDRSDEWTHVPEPSGLKVIIVGGGIGGFAAAIGLRKQGHSVHIYESSSFSREVGAALHVAPNANAILKKLGIAVKDIGANLCESLSEYTYLGVKGKDTDLTAATRSYHHSLRLAHRVKLHDALRRAALSENEVGPPAKLFLSKAVREVDTASGTVYFRDGTSTYGDVVLGADGVHSSTRKSIPGGNMELISSGQSAFRFLVPRAEVLADPRTRRFAEKDGNMHGFFGPDRSVIMYPTCDNTLLNLCCVHPEATSTTAEGWGSTAKKSLMLDVYSNFHPDIIALIDKADEGSLKVWKLLDMERLPKWTDGHLAVLGDAAHPFLPFLGQGGAMAIEDAVSLSVVLERGLKREDVPERLELYQSIRKHRAELIQEYTRMSGSKRGDSAKFDAATYNDFCFAYDEFDNSSQRLREWKWTRPSLSSPRMNSVFGPIPCPKLAVLPLKPSFTTASIKFNSSRSVIRNLLPPGDPSYRFSTRGGQAECTLSQTSLRGVSWLGGRGYNILALYIHGIEHEDINGKTVTGAFAPIVFENIADSILATDREIANVPRVWSTIDVDRDHSSYRVRAGWEGQTWGTFYLDGLEQALAGNEDCTNTPHSDDGILLHRYDQGDIHDQPHTQQGQTVFLPHKTTPAASKTGSYRAWKASNATINLDAKDWASFPTLHHIISRLQEIPVHDVIEAKVVEGEGTPEFS